MAVVAALVAHLWRWHGYCRATLIATPLIGRTFARTVTGPVTPAVLRVNSVPVVEDSPSSDAVQMGATVTSADRELHHDAVTLHLTELELALLALNPLRSQVSHKESGAI